MSDQVACVMPNGWRGRWIRMQNFRLDDWLFHILAEHPWGPGNNMVPLDHRTLRCDDKGIEYVFSFLNDSFEIGIGYPDKWHVMLRRHVVHKFIWWYLKQWALGEWFGLRTWIWYKLLFRRVNRDLVRYVKA